MSAGPPRGEVAVTVGVACCNVERWIEECVESLFGQTFDDFEIVAIDDGSTDRTGEMLDRLAAGDGRLRVFHQENKGLGPARNEMLRRARGRFLTFIDGDDWLAAECLEKAHRRAVEEALDIVTFGWVRVEEGTGKTIKRRSDHEGLDLNDLDGLRQTFFSGRLNLMSPARLVRTGLYRDHGLSFPNALHEDFYVTPFLCLYGKRFGYIDEDLYFWRVRKGSIMQTISMSHIDGIIGAFHSWKARLAAEGRFERFRDAIAAGMFVHAAGLLHRIETLGGSDPVLLRYLRGRVRSIPQLERYRRHLSPEGRRRHARLVALLETATEEEGGTARHFPLLVAANERLQRRRAREKTGCVWDVVFAPHKDYHVVTSVPIACLLRRRGLKVAFLDFTDVRGDESSLGALARLGEEQSYGSGDFIAGGHGFRMLVVFNDWDRLSTRPLVLDAREAGAATVGFVEGICDFDDVDTAFRRDPYRSVEWVLGAGRRDRRHFGDLGRRFRVAGFARIAATLARPYRPPARQRAVINVNFTYGVLEEKRKGWLASAVEGCRLAGVDWVISRHPQDGGDLGAWPVDERPFEEAMSENAVLVSRFSSCIIEALAMGRGAVYHNPGIEKVETFRAPLGAYGVSYDAPGLAVALKAEMERLGKAAGRRRRFLAEHCDVSRNFRPHEKAAQALWRIHAQRRRKRALAKLVRNLSQSRQRAVRIAVGAPRFVAGIPARAPRLVAIVLALVTGLAPDRGRHFRVTLGGLAVGARADPARPRHRRGGSALASVFRKRRMEPSGDGSSSPDGRDATRRSLSHKVRAAARWVLPVVAVIAAALVAYGFDERWFEDDAMITMQYARNMAEGCGWSFNCGADDFATTSFLHTFLASIAFHISTEPGAALVLVKVYESTVIVLAVAAFFHMLVRMGIGRFAATLAAFCLLTNHNTFLYMSSGMENALYLLTLSLTFGATVRNRYVLVGGLTGICHLVRPEAALVGPIAALVDLLRRRLGDRAQTGRWMGDWARAGAVSLAVAAPVWIVFLVLKGTPVPVSGEIKLLTAANWGPFHDMIWPLIAHEIHWLPFVLAGLAISAYRRSLVLGPILVAAVLVALYSVMGLPKSPWYYLPLHFGFFAAAAAGIDFLVRTAGRYRSWLIPTCYAAMAGLLVSPIIDLPTRFSHTVANIHAVAAKRNDINRGTGEWLKLNAPSDAKAAIPNIGYIGFYGDTDIVDIVGLVTPDIARNRDEEDYWWDAYRPEIYGDKAVPWHRRFDDPRYELVAVKGQPRHHRERYALWLRSDLATDRVRRSWTLSGDQFERADAMGVAADEAFVDGSLRIAIPPDAQPTVKLVAHLDGQALPDERFPVSDLLIDLVHNLPKTPVDSLTVTLRSNSESGPGHAAFRMARGFLPERRQHSVLSQENIFEESNFNPGNLAWLELEYVFRQQGRGSDSPWLSIERLEAISFSGCRLSGNCTSRLWK